LTAKQIATRVDAVIAGLPLSFQTAIYLHEIEGLSYDDIADLLGCATATVRSRVFRAREIIVEKMGPLLDLQTGKGWVKH